MTNDNSNTQAHTLEAKSEDKRQFAMDEDIQQQAEKGRSEAQNHADALQTLTEGLASHQQQHLSLDARGQPVPEQLQNTEHQQHVTDGLAVGMVAAGLAAKKVHEIWQYRQEDRINQALESQNDPQIERENQAREQALQADLERWRESRQNLSHGHELVKSNDLCKEKERN